LRERGFKRWWWDYFGGREEVEEGELHSKI